MITTRTTTQRTAPAPWLRTVRTAHATLLIDYRNGQVTILTGDAARVWLTLVEEPGTEHTITSVDAAALAAISADFHHRGWLVVTSSPAPHPVFVRIDDTAASWGTNEVLARLEPPGPVPYRWRLAAFPVIMLVLAARQLGPRRRRFARLFRLTRLGARLSEADPQHARHAVRAVRHAARLIPARFACLEESVAATVLLAAAGRHATWCHGIATDPLRLHAWLVDRDGRPVDEARDTNRYTPITETPVRGREGGRR